ncbi:MAG: DUF1559 domain-containing protein [Pirellulales bacterium]
MSRRRAFTVIELIVLIAIIAILIALLLPAISAARAAAMKNSSRNNMKQLGLALQNHADTYRTFPPLYFTNAADQKGNLDAANVAGQYTWIVRVLPFIEEDSLYKQISSGSAKFTQPSDKVMVQDPAGKAGQIAPGARSSVEFEDAARRRKHSGYEQLRRALGNQASVVRRRRGL